MKKNLKLTLVIIGVFFIMNQAMAITCLCEIRGGGYAGVSFVAEKNIKNCSGDSCGSCPKEFGTCKPLAGNAPAPAEPDKPAKFTPNVPIGGIFTKGAEIEITNNLLSEYIKTWYNFIIGAIGILATVMIMYGGLKWLTSRGNSAVIGDAKEKIFSALIGLILVFLSYTILYLVNPNLVEIKSLDFSKIEPKEIDYKVIYEDTIRDAQSGTYSSGDYNGESPVSIRGNYNATAETEDREVIANQGISINAAAPRTQVSGLNDVTMEGVVDMFGRESDFRERFPDATIVITGGSEAVGHSGQSHPSGRAIDIRATNEASQYMESVINGLERTGSTNSGYPIYNGDYNESRVIIIDERNNTSGGAHWHIEFFN